MVGIDYRGDDYLYGLADVIRVIRVDFVNMTVNMVALPRDLIVEAPEGRFTAPDPYKINQAYLFGTPGFNRYLGTGLGGGALAEVIQHNFGVPIDHYGVINFQTFIDFIDAIDGVEVDLPGPVAGPDGGFSAGPQTLNGERALTLARIREGYGDAFRVRNQTLIMRAVLNKLIRPAYMVQVPALLDQFSGAFLTDLSIEQLGGLGVCFLRNFDSKNLNTFEAPSDLLTAGREFIPTLNGNAFVYRWDEQFLNWLYQSLLEK
jgi:polyisoprenyl-teichoic acid--peptidoglycan teichoic acid transferase